MDPVWTQAAKVYAGLDEAERARYWANLDAGQRDELTRALNALGTATPPHAASEPTPRPRGCGRGCAVFLRKGCLTFLGVFALITLWSNLPWLLAGPSTDRFALWPDSTKAALASRNPIEPFLVKLEKLKRHADETFFPINELRRWLATARLDTSDVFAISILNTVRDDAGWWFDSKSQAIGYQEVTSAVAILELSKPTADILARVPRSVGTPETLGDARAIGFDQPVRARSPGSLVGPAEERWYVTAPSNRLLLIGGRTAIEHVLAVQSGRRDGIRTRRIIRPLLETIEDSDEVYAHFIPPQRERDTPLVSFIVSAFSRIPGIDLLYDYRGNARGLDRLPDSGCMRTVAFQYHTRAAARLHTTALWVLSLFPDPDQAGLSPSTGPGLAVFTETAPCTGRATAWRARQDD